ncbi:hypothetical protein HD596_008289 [Nonomuraea jabiensis]|uniref:Uncharacterized protein n=1 Tax=Nonomuraea jabiensis TaxID=882448 RepID=A0A7W9GD07_9ACTN|nr:hypothetical protein [Nonomuraea jabiensis]
MSQELTDPAALPGVDPDQARRHWKALLNEPFNLFQEVFNDRTEWEDALYSAVKYWLSTWPGSAPGCLPGSFCGP